MSVKNISIFLFIFLVVISLLFSFFIAESNILAANPEIKETMCEKIQRYAKKAEGTPYTWGGESLARGMDCSGFIYWMSHQVGKPLPRTTSQRYYLSIDSKDKHWKDSNCGNIVWWTFSPDRPYGHLGIMIHGREFWQSGSSTGVTTGSFWKENYWDRNFSSCKDFF